jgi:hypothetical protein
MKMIEGYAKHRLKHRWNACDSLLFKILWNRCVWISI